MARPIRDCKLSKNRRLSAAHLAHYHILAAKQNVCKSRSNGSEAVKKLNKFLALDMTSDIASIWPMEAVAGVAGRQRWDPRLLVCLWLYAYSRGNGRRASGKAGWNKRWRSWARFGKAKAGRQRRRQRG